MKAKFVLDFSEKKQMYADLRDEYKNKRKGNDLTVFFSTNDTYAYKAILDENTFEFSKWGFTK